MRSVTPEQKKRIEQVIRDHHLAFMAEVLGEGSIPPEDYARLLAAGKIQAKKRGDVLSQVHTLGILAVERGEEKVSQLTAADAAKDTRPHTQVEKEAIAVARERLGAHIQGLGDKLTTQTRIAIADADDRARHQILTQVRETAAQGLAERRTVQEIASRLREVTGDNGRAWKQLAQTEVHSAIEEGKANAILSSLPRGEDPLVYKRVHPEACPFCRLLYLDGKKPRVFRLSELSANGTNTGRRAKRPTHSGPSATEWKATLGAVHPWCRCTLHHLREGFAFDAEGQLHYVGVKKSLEQVQRLNVALLDHACEHE